MKKLIIKIGNETHELPYNNEVFSFEVSEKYMPKAGDCVMVEYKNPKGISFYWLKIKKVVRETFYFSLMVEYDLNIAKDRFFINNNSIIFTKITTEELKAKYDEAGYDWDYETDTIKPLKWMPKDGDEVWYLLDDFTIVNGFYNENLYYLLEKGLLFQTEEDCKKFAEYCLKYLKK